MNGMHRTQFDRARFDLLPLVIWSRVFWKSVKSVKRAQAQRWSGERAKVFGRPIVVTRTLWSLVIASLYVYFVFLLGQLWSSPGPRAAPLFRADWGNVVREFVSPTCIEREGLGRCRAMTSQSQLHSEMVLNYFSCGLLRRCSIVCYKTCPQQSSPNAHGRSRWCDGKLREKRGRRPVPLSRFPASHHIPRFTKERLCGDPRERVHQVCDSMKRLTSIWNKYNFFRTIWFWTKGRRKSQLKRYIWLFKILDPSLMDVKSWTREGFFGQKPLFVPLGTVWHRDAGQCVWLKKRNISMWDINNIISDSSDQRLTVFLVFIDQSV